MKNKLKIITVIITLFTMLGGNCFTLLSHAQTQGEKISLYKKTYCNKVLVYQGISRGAVYVEYEQNGEKYPAYCLDGNLDGIGDIADYSVTNEGNVQDVQIWKIVTNGYPYKSLEELGVETEEEAYLATKQALYCYVHNRDVNNYSSDGSESGNRTLNALRQIVTNSKSSTIVPVTGSIKIINNQEEWIQDDVNKNYVSKVYEITTSALINNYLVSLDKAEDNREILVTDLNNNIKNTFSYGEKFKVLIPINDMTDEGTFSINIETKMLTNSVLYGKAPNNSWQSYALTTDKYELVTSKLTDKYYPNKSQIKIIKQDNETKEAIPGVKFEIEDDKGNVIYNNLVSNENGEVIIENVIPGKYTLKEVEAVDGYIEYDEPIAFEVELNEAFNITVNNTKKIEIKPKEKEYHLEVSNNIEVVELQKVAQSQKVVKTVKLPVTGM